MSRTPATRSEPSSGGTVNQHGDTQADAPYSDAVQDLAGQGWQRLHVPGHQGRASNVPELAGIIGERPLALDLPVLFTQIDQETWRLGAAGPTPMIRSAALAAEAWGAGRAWFLTNGASMGNQVASLAARMLGTKIVVQRSMHSSAIHGMILAGLDPSFVEPAIDQDLGSAHGVTATQVDVALIEQPDAAAVFIVSPSYFGAVADVRAIASVCHRREVPLIVDESWGSHLGFHPEVPSNAIREGADLVISSSHKSIGSLFQSAMLFAGSGENAARLSAAVDRVYPTVQSTSSSALLMVSLDQARRSMALFGEERLHGALEDAAAIRTAIRERGRFRDAGDRMRESWDVFALDPLKVVIDTPAGGISGSRAHYLLMRDHRVYPEMATPGAVVALIGATARVDVERFVTALHALPHERLEAQARPKIPSQGARRVSLREAYFAEVEVVSRDAAIGRVSADALAAYPPGIPNVLPGEEITAEALAFLSATASSESGHVRGAVVADVSQVRVLARQP